MKKKVKDLTIGEIIDMCRKSDDCLDCPLYIIPACSLPCGTIYERTRQSVLEKEVEI